MNHKALWAKTRKQWVKENPGNHQGYWECYLCDKWVTLDNLTVDHVIPRSNRPDLRYEQSNLKPCCWECNTEKGSKHD